MINRLAPRRSRGESAVVIVALVLRNHSVSTGRCSVHGLAVEDGRPVMEASGQDGVGTTVEQLYTAKGVIGAANAGVPCSIGCGENAEWKRSTIARRG